jgi:hypothetical protein
MTLSITTLNMISLFATLTINDIQHNSTLCYAKRVYYAECRYVECLYVECLYVECLYVECRYADCRYAE